MPHSSISRRSRRAGVTAAGMAVAALTMGGMVSMADPTSEYLSEVFYDRVLFFSQGWGELGMDTCAHAPGKKPSPLRIKDQQFERGLGHHAPGEILVDLNGEYEAFEADIGVQWQSGDTGTVVFQVFVDGEKRFDSGVVRERDAARHIRVPVKGADELRLAVTDAGDGITCDCADWANARLVRDASAAKRPRRDRFDAAPFARVVTFDPARMNGTRAGRTQEFPAQDIFLDTDVPPNEDGTYTVPTAEDGRGCIGLQWVERRFLRELAIEFADADALPRTDGVEAQYWAGESSWQGEWKTVDGPLDARDRRWSVRPRWAGDPDTMRRGVQKVRWVFGPTERPIKVQRLSALTISRWETISLRLQLEPPIAGQRGRIEAYNGEFIEPIEPDDATHRAWDLSAPLQVKLRYARPRTLKSDRTVLRFHLPTGDFAVAVEDVLTRGQVYIPRFGFYVAREPDRVSLAEYRKQIQGRQTVLDRVRQMPDQTFAKAVEKVHRPVQNNGPVMLSLACDNRKFVVERDGTFGPYKPGKPHPSYTFHVVPRFGSGASPLGTRRLDGGWLPVPTISAQESGVVYRERAFVAPERGSDGSAASRWHQPKPLFVAEFEMENSGRTAAAASLALDLVIDDEAALGAVELQADASGAVLRSGEKLLALIRTDAAPLDVRLDGRSVTVSGELPPDAEARCRVYIPGWDESVAEARSVADGAPDVADVEEHWASILGSAMQVEIPDPLLENVIKASQVYCLMAARNEADGARIAPWIASDRYGPLESEGHSIVLGMDLFGHRDFARRCLDFYIARYNDAGYLTTGYTLMGTGQHLWTLSEHFALTHDEKWLKENAKDIARVCRWIAEQRKKTEKLSASGERRPEYGLMPPGVVADWGMYSYRFFMEAYFCAGLRAGAQALAGIGYPDADALLKDAEGFSEDVLRAYRWAQARTPAVPLLDGAFAPGIPPMLYCFGPAGEFYPGADWNRSWAGDVETGAHHLVALGIMDAASDDCDWMTDILEDRWCLRDGMHEYPGDQNRADWFDLGGFSKLQPYYTRLPDLHALRDDVKPFIRSYFNTLPSLLNLENLSLWEHFHNAGAWNKTHETGWFLQQTRTMLVMERGSELWLAPFVTGNWLEDGMAVAVTNAPTRFGPVSYEIRSVVRRGRIEARIEPPTRSAPDAIVIRLRHPEGKRMRSVTVNGKPHTDFDAERECVRIRPTAGTIVVRAEY